jgi:hypothetical protein
VLCPFDGAEPLRSLVVTSGERIYSETRCRVRILFLLAQVPPFSVSLPPSSCSSRLPTFSFCPPCPTILRTFLTLIPSLLTNVVASVRGPHCICAGDSYLLLSYVDRERYLALWLHPFVYSLHHFYRSFHYFHGCVFSCGLSSMRSEQNPCSYPRWSGHPVPHILADSDGGVGWDRRTYRMVRSGLVLAERLHGWVPHAVSNDSLRTCEQGADARVLHTSRITTLIISPTPLLAANFIILSAIISALGPEYSRLTPKLCTLHFVHSL